MSPIERMIASVQEAVARDTIDRAIAANAFEQIVVVTSRPAFAEQLPDPVAVEIDPPTSFHFGRRLERLVAERPIQKLVYLGAGLPLLNSRELAAIAHRLVAEDRLVLANNLYSADLVAFSPAAAITSIPPAPTDNALAQLLRLQAGLPAAELPRTAATQLDIDTPTDLLVLGLHPGSGPHTRQALAGLSLDRERINRAAACFTNPNAEIIVAGRVGSQVWSYLERETACRVRLFSEERGMRADGREERGAVRSLLGFYLDEVGPERAFAGLAGLGQAAFVDSRVLFAHLGVLPSTADRFASDLGLVDQIVHPVVRAITTAALAAPIPIVLGGHSLVAGGLMALVEATWLRSGVAAER